MKIHNNEDLQKKSLLKKGGRINNVMKPGSLFLFYF